MRVSITDRTILKSTGTIGAAIESLLAPFQAQSASIRSMVVIGCGNIFRTPQAPPKDGESDSTDDAVLLRLATSNAPDAPRAASAGHLASHDDLLSSLAEAGSRAFGIRGWRRSAAFARANPLREPA